MVVKGALASRCVIVALVAVAAAVGPMITGAGGGDGRAGGPSGSDWPTYMHDNNRSGTTEERLSLPLALIWTRDPDRAPAPAWPPPAPFDYFHRKALSPRVVFDRAFHVVSSRGRVLWGSSSTDTVHCAELETGKELWRFHAEGPIRVAPAIAGDKVAVGSDDGRLYCLDARTGALIWKRRVVEDAPFIAGNGRLISSMPVRSGGLVHGGRIHFCAGLFPQQGVRHGMADMASGEIVATAKVRTSVQGYLFLKDGKVHAERGRAKPGRLEVRLGAPIPDGPGGEAPAKTPGYPYAVIAAATHVFRGGDDKVAAFAPGRSEPLWSADVDGKAYSLAVARQRLLVSTDKGRIYCFGPDVAGPPREHRPNHEAVKRGPAVTALAEAVLESCGRRRGYGLILGADPGCALAMELARQSEMKIVIREAGRAEAAKAKAVLSRAGMYGRISVHEGSLDRLPYGDYLFNLVLHGGLVTKIAFGGSREEARRVVAPVRGVAMLGSTPADVWKRPALEGAGRWSHFYADAGNTACSGDRRITADLALQWFGEPGPEKMVDRHNRTIAPLSVSGRLFVSGVDWFVGVDAYNGTILWEKDVPESLRMAAPKTCSNMVATDSHLYVASGPSCLRLSAETGTEERRFKATDGDWGYVAMAKGILVGSTVPTGSLRWKFAHDSWKPGYEPRRFVICSRDLFALDPKTGRRKWKYEPGKGVIPCPAVAIGAGTVFLVESTNPASRQVADGHVTLDVLVGAGASLVALDLETGGKLWARPVNLEMRNCLYLSCKDGKVLIGGSVNRDGGWYLLYCHDARDGRRLWETGRLSTKNTTGSHGELVKHPTIVGETIYLYNDSFSLRTGVEAPWKLGPSRCGERSASARYLFWRKGGVMMSNSKGEESRALSRSSRPGCWLNIVPAGGLVLIPEGSSGCRCEFPIQGSMAFRPR